MIDQPILKLGSGVLIKYDKFSIYKSKIINAVQNNAPENSLEILFDINTGIPNERVTTGAVQIRL